MILGEKRAVQAYRCLPYGRGRIVMAGGFDFSEEVALASCEAGAYIAYLSR